jgi:hypothetical protein
MSPKFYLTDIGTIGDWVLLSKKKHVVCVWLPANTFFSLLIWPLLARKVVTTTVYSRETHTKHSTGGELNSPEQHQHYGSLISHINAFLLAKHGIL